MRTAQMGVSAQSANPLQWKHCENRVCTQEAAAEREGAQTLCALGMSPQPTR
jgi:hypothetical protein